MVFDGRNTYTGTTTVSAGTLKLGTVGLLGNGTYSKDISISSGAVLEYASSATQTLAGAVSGAGALVMSGTGLLTLSGTNTYTGTTTVSSGTLSLSHTNALPVTMDVYLTTGTGVNVNLSEGTHVIRRLYLDNKLYFKGVLNASNVPGGLLTGTGSFFCTEGNPRGTLISFF